MVGYSQLKASMRLVAVNIMLFNYIIIIIIKNIYIALILFSSKRFTLLQKGLNKNKNPKIITYIHIYIVTKIQNKKPKIVRKLV